jgi:hypothetical protein
MPIPIADRRVDHHRQLARCHQLLIERLCYNRHQIEDDEPPLKEENEDAQVVEEF